jgi:hypothetical protein
MNNSIIFKLDEAYPWHIENKYGRLNPKARLEIPVYGEVEIAYRANDDWWVKGITLSASNGKCGKDCEGWEQEIFGSHPLYKPIERYLQEIASDDVSEAIRADIRSQIDDYNFQRGKDKARGFLY